MLPLQGTLIPQAELRFPSFMVQPKKKKKICLVRGMKIRHHHRNMETCEASQVAQWLRIRCQCRRCKRCRFDPWVGKMPWRRKWHPTPIFLPGTSHAQRSLVGYSPRGCKESDATERLSTQPHKNMWLLLLSHFSRV